MEGATDPAGSSANLISSIAGWATHPFSNEMNIKGWALFVGLILVLTILWLMVLHDLRGSL